MKKRLLSLTLVMAMIFTQISALTVFAEDATDYEQIPTSEEIQSTVEILRPSDATYVSQNGDDATTNFYGSSVMKVNYTNSDGLTEAWGQYGYMKFNMDTIDKDSITSAKLRLYVEGGDTRSSTRTVGIFETWDSEWDGSNITWKNGKSEAKTELGSFTVSSNGIEVTDKGWREIDVTEYVQNSIDTHISLMAKMTSQAAYNVDITSGVYTGLSKDFDDSVYEKNMPQLVIECNENKFNPCYSMHISSSQDTYVDQNGGNATSSFANSEYLKVNYTHDESVTHYFGSYSYVDFDISEVNRDAVSEAKLWVYVDKESDGRLSTRTIDIFKPATEWNSSMTWVSGRVAPEGDAMASFTVSGNGRNVADAGWRCIDVTDYIKSASSNTASFMMKAEEGSAHPVLIRSNEHNNEETRPQLIVTASDPIESKFVDGNFLNEVRKVIGKTNNEHIYVNDVEHITSLDVSEKNINDLAGIEYFADLKELNCYVNKLTNLDLSYNVNLEMLDCGYNPRLKSINTYNNILLKEFYCDYSGLTGLDVRKNVNLVNLVCDSNPIGTLDVSKNVLLEELSVYDTGLPNLDVSNNKNLTSLDCSYNQMRSQTDVEGINNTKISESDGTLEFGPQSIGKDISKLFTDEIFLGFVRQWINKPTGEIYQTDLDGITSIEINGEKIKSLDGIEQFRFLEKLDIECNRIDNLDLTSNKMLKIVNCAQNGMKNINVSNNIELQEIDARNNHLIELDVTRDRALTTVDVTKNELTDLDLSNSINLESVLCTRNYFLTEDNVSLPNTIYLSSFSDEFTNEPTNCGGISVQFAPQRDRRPIKDPFLSCGMTYVGDSQVQCVGTTAKERDVTVYDLTDKVGELGIAGKETLQYSIAEEKPIIDTILGGSYESCRLDKIESNEDGDYDGKVTLTDTSSDRILVVIAHFDKNNDGNYKGASAIIQTVIVTEPRITRFTFNNSSSTVDILNTELPLIKSLGWVGGYTTIQVDIANSTGKVQDVYVNIRRDRWALNKMVPLSPVKDEDGNIIEGKYMYYGKDILNGSEGTDDDKNLTATNAQYGEIKVLYTTPTNDTKQELYKKNIIYVHDPSGYIYEAVPSNRLEGVKTTLYYMNSDGEAVEWNAKNYGQTNPIFTDKNGYYEWYVPKGLWKVKAELEGYDTFISEKWLKVPPAQMDVNFGMISYQAPEVKSAYAYPDRIEIEFSKYMKSEDMTTDNITVFVNGEQKQGEIAFLNEKQDFWQGTHNEEVSGGTEEFYVSKILFTIPKDDRLTVGDNLTININQSVRSYAGTSMNETYEKNIDVENRATGMSLNDDNNHSMSASGDEYTIYYGDTENFEIQILPREASRGKKLYLKSDCKWAAQVPEEVTIDENGVATIPVTGVLPGKATINMQLGNSNLTQKLDVEIILRD